jgi:hypothetical protein
MCQLGVLSAETFLEFPGSVVISQSKISLRPVNYPHDILSSANVLVGKAETAEEFCIGQPCSE